MTVKGVFKGIGQFFRYLFLTPAGGSKRRAEQQAYEEQLDEAMKRVQAERERSLGISRLGTLIGIGLKRTIVSLLSRLYRLYIENGFKLA